MTGIAAGRSRAAVFSIQKTQQVWICTAGYGMISLTHSKIQQKLQQMTTDRLCTGDQQGLFSVGQSAEQNVLPHRLRSRIKWPGWVLLPS